MAESTERSLAFRQAVASAINREAVARAAGSLYPQVQPAFRLQLPVLPGFDASIRGYAYDPNAAKEFWRQLQEEERPASITILVRTPSDPALSARERDFLRAWYDTVETSLEQTLGIAVTMQGTANFNTLARAIRESAAPIWMARFGSGGSDSRSTAGAFSLAIINTAIRGDEEVGAAVGRGDWIQAEELVLKKALLVPIVYYVSP